MIVASVDLRPKTYASAAVGGAASLMAVQAHQFRLQRIHVKKFSLDVVFLV